MVQPPFVLLSLIHTYAGTHTLSHTLLQPRGHPRAEKNGVPSNCNLPVIMTGELWCSETHSLAAKSSGEAVSWKTVVYFCY